MNADAQRVKAAAPLLNVVSDYVRLRKSGAGSWVGRCVFHNEKTASFTVHDKTHATYAESFKCFGCGAGGDVLSFVQAIEGLSFSQALRSLAERFGVSLDGKRVTPAEARYFRNITAQGEFMWRSRISAAEAVLAETMTLLMERGSVADELRAEAAGFELRRIRSDAAAWREMDPAERGKVLLKIQTRAEYRDFKRSHEAEEWLVAAVRERDAEVPFSALLDTWAGVAA